MSYLALPDFKFGTDRRRRRVSGVPGTLWTLKNAHITRGGDIESVKQFVAKYTLPAGTLGLTKLRRQLYAFGSADLAATMPIGVNYQRLQSPSGATMVRILDAKVFAGKIYAIAEYDSGNVYHFYDGTRVSDWDALADGNSSYTTLAAYLEEKNNGSEDVTALASGSTILITANEAGTAFTIARTIVNNGADNTQTLTLSTVQANVAEVVEVRATGAVTITGGTSDPGVNYVDDITVNGVSLLTAPVNWVSSNSATANAVVVAINNGTATHGYTAVAVGAAITIKAAPGTGATPNAYAIAVSEAGNVTESHDATMSGGVTYVAPVAQVSKAVFGGTYEATDKYTITINSVDYVATGRASGTGVNVFVSKNRVWSVAGSLLNGCKLNTPSDWDDATASTGSVSIDVSNESDGSERLLGMANYQQYAAVFSQTEIRIYQLDADATQIQLVQTVDNTGSRAGRSIIGYGNTDVFYLDTTGIRSLRQREQVNSAYASDVGNPIDTFIREHIDELPNETITRAVGLIEPIDGRLWLSLGERIYVLSFFPSSKINAWSYYEPPEDITELVRVGDKVYARGGNTVYLYGGDEGTTYPEDEDQDVVVELPFLTAEKPANQKTYNGSDLAITNEWRLWALPDPNDETKEIEIGRFNRNTNHLPDNAIVARSTTLAAKLTCTRGGKATLSGLVLHFGAKEPAK